MSHENVDMVRKAFEAYSAGGIESLLPFYAPDVVLYPDPEWPEDSVYEGHHGARKQDALWVDNFDDYGWEAHEIRDLDEVVLALAETTGRAKASGAPFRQQQGIVASDFRDGTIGQVRFFTTWQQTLEAAGLEA